MMYYREMIIQGLLYLNWIYFVLGQFYGPDDVNVTWMENVLLNDFNTLRHHKSANGSKALAAQFIIKHFESISLTVELDEFQTEFGINGTNIIGILPGFKFGKEDDIIFVVGAHYDTKYGKRHKNEGAFENGAGVVAMMEAAKKLALSREKQYTIIFVAFDLRETGFGEHHTISNDKCCLGSRQFIQHWIKDFLNRQKHIGTEPKFGGAFLLESVLYYNSLTHRQIIPEFYLPVPIY